MENGIDRFRIQRTMLSLPAPRGPDGAHFLEPNYVIIMCEWIFQTPLI